MGKEGTYIRSWPIASTKDNFHNSKLNNNNKTKVVLLAMKCPLACLQYLKKGTEKECKQQVHKNALYFWYTQDTRWFNVDRLPSLTKFQANPHLQIKLWEISLVKIKHGHKANRHVQGHGAPFSTVFFVTVNSKVNLQKRKKACRLFCYPSLSSCMFLIFSSKRETLLFIHYLKLFLYSRVICPFQRVHVVYLSQ